MNGARIDFSGCGDLTVVVSGGTNYAPDARAEYRDPSLDPERLARTKVRAAAAHPAATLLRTHVADYRALYGRLDLSLGTSTPGQRALDTWERLTARARDRTPDPELEAAYLQFGRYLMISGSRGSLPLNLQGLWLDGNDPDWMGDYHTDINLQMNYWMADRTGLSPCFDALTDYCLAQLPSWTALTRSLFNDPRNRYRNSTGKNAGWTVAISTNPHGGMGWWWHPAGNAWLAGTLWEHYEFAGLPHPPGEDLPAAEGRLRVLGGAAAAHDPARQRAAGPRRRQRLVPRTRPARRPGHHLRPGAGVGAVRPLPDRGRGTGQGRRLRGHRQPACANGCTCRR